MSGDVSPPDDEQAEWINAVAVGISRAFPLVERQDIGQQLYLLWYEKWEVLRKMLDHPEKSRQLVQTCLRRWAFDYAKTETAMIRGWSQEDMQQYPPRMVAELLPFLLDVDAWSTVAAKGGEGAASPKLKNQAGDALAIYADLTKSWNEIRREDREVLHQRYVLGENLETLGQWWGVSEETARKRCERALGRLATQMDGLAKGRRQRLPPAGRRAVSNSKAAALTSQGWQE